MSFVSRAIATVNSFRNRIKEKLGLEKSKVVSELIFQLKEGYLTDVTDN